MKRLFCSPITLLVLFLFPQDSSAQFKNSEKEEFFYGEHSYVLQGNFKVDSYSKHAAGRVTFTHVPSGSCKEIVEIIKSYFIRSFTLCNL